MFQNRMRSYDEYFLFPDDEEGIPAKVRTLLLLFSFVNNRCLKGLGNKSNVRNLYYV